MSWEIRPLKRKWARIYWGCAACLLLSVALFLGSRGNLWCCIPIAVFLAGMAMSQDRLRCPCCGRSLSTIPRIRRSAGPCRYCGKSAFYDDETGRTSSGGEMQESERPK